MAMNLPKLPDTEQVGRNIIRVLGGNPSKFTLQGTNTYILGRGPRRILIDTAEGKPTWSNNLSKTLQSQTSPFTISTCLLTHWHHDHISGVKDLQTHCPDVRLYKNTPNLNPDGILDVDQISDIQDGQRFSDEENEIEVQALHCPGHTKDHMAFVITKSTDPADIGSIFTGDNVLGHGTAVFEDLAVYLQSLAVMKKRVDSENNTSSTSGGKAKVKAYPAHGAVIDDAAAKIDEYIHHRQMREDEAINVLKYGTPKAANTENVGKEVTAGKEWTSMEMVKVIYYEYPESLHRPAEGGLLMVLEKLQGEGRVVKTEDGKWKITIGDKGML